MKKILSIGIVSLLVIGGFIGVLDFENENKEKATQGIQNIAGDSESSESGVFGYTSHDPIYINGNAGFTPANGVTSGSGIQSDPYIIEGWDIDASLANGIEICNTDAYFIIRNCYVHDGGSNTGTYFYNVQNGQIENTDSLNNACGIGLSYSSYNSVFNNNASDKSYGISLSCSSNNSVYNNIANLHKWYGIFMHDSSYNSVFNNNASNNTEGIILLFSSNNNIFNNTANSNNLHGIDIHASSNNNILSNNTASNNDCGILLSSSSYNTLDNNTFENDGIFISGGAIEYFNTHNIDTTNTANGKPIYYYKNQSGINIDGWSAGQVILANCTNCTVKNVDCSNASVGAELAYCNNCSIEDSIFNNGSYGIWLLYSSYNKISNTSANSNNDYGIWLYYSNNNNIFNNNDSNNGDGICLRSSSNNNLFNNSANSNIDNGIRLHTWSSSNPSNNNILSNNSVSNNMNYGIYLYSSSNNNISNNSANSNDDDGIYLDSSSDNNILSNNSVNSNNGAGIDSRGSYINIFNNSVNSNNHHGIYLWHSDHNNIHNNDINSNNGDGIYLSVSSYNTLVNNTFENNGIYIYGNTIGYFNTHNIDPTNTANSEPIYYYKNQNDINIDGWSAGQIILANCKNFIIKNMDCSNASVGVQLAYCDYCSIEDSIFNNETYGICLRYSSYNNIHNNKVSNNYEGINMHSSTHNDIYNNSASNNDYGIYLDSSSYNDIYSNNVLNNEDGICLYKYSNNNWVYHNNFMDHIRQAYDKCTNYWDDGHPSGGNYWSDYPGVDEKSGPNQDQPGSDGIGDTPYNIFGGSNQDHYPLMTPWGVPPTITSVTPQNLTTNIPVTTNIIVIFSEPMNRTTTQDAFTLKTGGVSLSGIFSWNFDNDTMTFDPTTNLLEDATYWVNITTEATDLFSDSLSSPWSSLFTTEDVTPPTITNVIAVPHLQEVHGHVNISSDVSDNVNVDTVWVNITDPDDNIMGNFTMTHYPINDRYYKNRTYDIIGTYHFIIWANDISNNWNSSSGQFTIQDTMPPATPTGLMVVDVPSDEGGALDITWDANTELDLDHYTLYCNKTGSWIVVAEIPAGIEYYVDTELTDGTRYYYKISASDITSNESPQSATASRMPADNLPPATPTGLTAQDYPNDEGGAIDLDWDDNTELDLDHYDIYRSTTSGGPYTWLAETTLSEYTDSTTTDGVTYYYVVTASDEVPNESGYSNEASASSLEYQPQGTIFGVVKDKDDNPIEGATVTVYENGTTTNPVASTTADSNGEYSVDIPPGTYDIKIEKSGYETQWEKDVVVTADQTTTADSTLPSISPPTTDILSDYWWLILLVILIIVIIIIVTYTTKKKKPVEKN